jgi:predicted RNase H-like HicB family nuclease
MKEDSKVRRFIRVTIAITEEKGGGFSAVCNELGTASCGDTLDEVRKNILEAIEVHLNALESCGERNRFFKSKNIKLISSENRPKTRKISVPSQSLTMLRDIPVNA